jgi:hypothetical protein
MKVKQPKCTNVVWLDFTQTYTNYAVTNFEKAISLCQYCFDLFKLSYVHRKREKVIL